MKRSKKTILIILSITLLVAGIIAVCAGLYLKSTAGHARRISELLQPMMGAKNQTMHVALSAEINGEPLELESDLYLVTEDGISYLAVEQNGFTVYVADNVLFLENGKAFKIGNRLQKQMTSYEDLLPHIGVLYDVLKITAAQTENETAYSITVTGERMDTLLAVISPGEALPVSGIEKLKLCLTERNGNVERIVFSGNGALEEMAVSLNVTLSGFRMLASGDYPIPAEVKQSAATVDPDALFSLTEDMYRLVLALGAFEDQQSMDGTLVLSVDCSLLQLDTQMRLSDLQTNANSQIDPEKLRALPEMLVWLCMEGDIRCDRKDTAFIYTLTLDDQAMQDLAQMILPELRQFGDNLTEGSASIVLENNGITNMSVTIEGKISAWIAQIPIAVRAEYFLD